jgi:hypothetical protein
LLKFAHDTRTNQPKNCSIFGEITTGRLTERKYLRSYGRFYWIENAICPPQVNTVPVADDDRVQHIVLTDIEIPFGSMVFFMVKWAVASIPAAIILGMLGTGVWLIANAVIALFPK